MCGKNNDIAQPFEIIVGSPPRVREKHLLSILIALCFGITPACAGKTRAESLGLKVTRDHPRVCGKNVFVAIFYPFAAGSPPRVREKLDLI